MRNLLILAAISTAATSAMATYCPDGSTIESHPNGDCNYREAKKDRTVPTITEARAAAVAVAGANSSANVGNVSSSTGPVSNRQQQQQAQSLRNSNSSVSGGGNVTISGDAAGSGDRSSFVAWAPIIHGPAAPALASANLVVVPGVCGPRVRVITTQIVGQHYGPMGGRYDEGRGYMETIGQYLDENGNPTSPFVRVDGYLMGHVVTQYAAVVGTSSAASFSVGGFVDSKGLQGGAAGSGAAQQLVKSLQVMDCVMPTERPLIVPVARPVRRPVRRVVPAAVAPCALQCVPTRDILAR